MKTDSSKTYINTSMPGDIAYHSNLLLISFQMRIFNLLVALICASVLKYLMKMPVPDLAFNTFYTWFGICIISMALIKRYSRNAVRLMDKVHFIYYFPGVLCATFAMYSVGTGEGISLLFYFFDLVYANILLRRKRGIGVTVFTAVCYAATLLAEAAGWIPHKTDMFNMASSMSTASLLVSASAFIFLMSFSVAVFSRMREERERSVIDSRNRYEAKSRQLEEITRALRKNIAENKYLKAATMGYIEKKEFEVDTAKKDLEAQIEKLRETQKAMVFMIEDLNGMSAQLKDARDHLEEKVRERTDELLSISQKLHRSERLAFLGKLAGSVTHELRNPLAVLKNATYYLERKFGPDQDPKIIKYKEIIKKELNIIDAIIDDIMGFAKTKSPDYEEADIADVLDNALDTVNVPELVKVVKKYDSTPKIMADCNQLMHALMNIINNAIMAMKGNGTLTLCLMRVNDNICIEVGDTGPGISPEHTALIFEPLYSSKPKGTGLGLPIAKMMVENQEGTISFNSELGEGTVFRVVLPIEKKAYRK